MIYSLVEAINTLKLNGGVNERMNEACEKLPSVGIVGLNGIPFLTNNNGDLTYFGNLITVEIIKQQLRNGMGFGAVLTFMNRSNNSLDSLTDICLDKGHDWSCHSINVTMAFSGAPTFVEISFARDSRFHLSWVEPKTSTDWNKPRLFTATASLKDWKKYLRNANSLDFCLAQREWLLKAKEVFDLIFPEYFTK